DGEALIERALALNPNLAWAWLFSRSSLRGTTRSPSSDSLRAQGQILAVQPTFAPLSPLEARDTSTETATPASIFLFSARISSHLFAVVCVTQVEKSTRTQRSLVRSIANSRSRCSPNYIGARSRDQPDRAKQRGPGERSDCNGLGNF